MHKRLLVLLHNNSGTAAKLYKCACVHLSCGCDLKQGIGVWRSLVIELLFIFYVVMLSIREKSQLQWDQF